MAAPGKQPVQAGPAEVDPSLAAGKASLETDVEVQWEWCGDGLCWTAYPCSTSFLIEAAFQAQEPKVDFSLSHTNYSVHFRPREHRQKNLVTNGTRAVKRERNAQGTCGSWLWWNNEIHSWHAYDAELAQRIEDAWNQSKTSITSKPPAGLFFAIRGHPYSMEFETDGVQYNVRTRFARGVRRRLCSSGQSKPALNKVSQLQDSRMQGHTPSSSSSVANGNHEICSSSHPRASSSVQGEDDVEALSYNPNDLIDLANPPETEDCSICLSSLEERGAATLTKCNHSFHRDCIEYWFKSRPTCPECLMLYGTIFGTQPPGEMRVQYITCSGACLLAGYPNTDVIKIIYNFPDGVQTTEHPNPGKRYAGTFRTAYLPKTSEGEEVLELLKKAWTRRLLFRIGTSVTTGQKNVVTYEHIHVYWFMVLCHSWAGIHHKTRMTGGSSHHGYPDDTYLVRVKKELEDIGVV